jgi:hypothetical protein
MNRFTAALDSVRAIADRGRGGRRRRGEPQVGRQFHLHHLWLEQFEDRRLLSLDNLLQTLADPSTALHQQGSLFGYAVATDGNLTVVGASFASLQGFGSNGCAYVFNTSAVPPWASYGNRRKPNLLGKTRDIPRYTYLGGGSTDVRNSRNGFRSPPIPPYEFLVICGLDNRVHRNFAR